MPSLSNRSLPSQASVSGRRLVVAVVLSVVLGVGAGLATPPVLSALLPSWTAIEKLAAVITAEVYLALLVAHLVAFGGWSGVRDRLRLGRTSGRNIGLAVAVTVGTWLAAALLYIALNPFLGWTDDIWRTVMWVGADGGRLAGAGAALFIIAAGRACVLAPIGEELLFRGSLFGWLRRRLSFPVTALITSVLFALIHQMPVVFPLTFLFGLAAGWLRERTGSLTPAVVLHVLNNVAMVAVSYLLTGWEVAAPGMV